MKKIFGLLTGIVLLLLLGLYGVVRPSVAAQETVVPQGTDKPMIVATVFPAYDFARAILGDASQVRLLLPPGSDSHHYEPTPQDMMDIHNAELFIGVGGESEHWVEEVLGALGGQAPTAFWMLECVTGLEEEHSHSMSVENHEDAQEHALDEHVWTSPKRAKEVVGALAQTLMRLHPQAASHYEQNANAYLLELDKLDQALTEAVKEGARRKIIFGDRFPFRYLAHDYGLSYDAAFPGCSEDSEPSAQTLVSLIQEIQRDGIPVVFYIEFSNRKTADILAEETGAKPMLLHSCHNVSAEEIQGGATYLSVMWKNVAALKEALR